MSKIGIDPNDLPEVLSPILASPPIRVSSATRRPGYTFADIDARCEVSPFFPPIISRVLG